MGCSILISCTGTGTGTGSGIYGGSGFFICTVLNACTGIGSGGIGNGFLSCTVITNCTGSGTGSSYGYGFADCKKMQQNRHGTCTTAAYNTSYADAGMSYACADTAAGGYNS
jgi:hypothetical protein